MSWLLVRKCLGFLPAIAAIAGRPGAAVAEEPRARFSLVAYSATSSCPSRAAFVQAILLRAPKAHEATGSEAALMLEVRLEALGEQTKGHLSVRGLGGQWSERQVPPASCSEVAESMAVIVALLLEEGVFRSASSSGGATPAVAASEPPKGVDATVEVAPAPAASAPPSRAVATRTSAGASSVLVDERAAGSLSTRSRLRFGASVGGVWESAASPSPALGVLVSVDGWLDRAQLWSPSLRLAAYQVGPELETTSYGAARFRLRAFRLSGCPLRFPARSRLFARACAVFDAGELWARGENVAGGKDQNMVWLAAGVAGRFEVAMFSFLSLEAESQVRALYQHDEFVLVPSNFSVHSVAPVSVGATLGLTLRMP